MAVDITSGGFPIQGVLNASSFYIQDDISKSSCSPSENSSDTSSPQTSSESSASPKTSQPPAQSSEVFNSLTSTDKTPLEDQKQRGPPLKFPPCIICGGKASGLHYGCNTCEACKNFYRRHLIKQNAYICPKNNECDISFINKSNCSACRVAKCLKFGMSKTKSRLGRYTYSRRTETIKEVKKLEGKKCKVSHLPSSVSTQNLQKIAPSSVMNLTEKKSEISIEKNFDESLITSLTKALDDINIYEDKELMKEEVITARCKEHSEKFERKVKMFGSMNAVSKEEYKTLLKEFDIDIDDAYKNCKTAYQVWDGIMDRYAQFAKALPGFLKLSKNDQDNLVKSSHCSAFTVLMHRSYRAEYNVLIEVDGRPYHLEEYCDKFMSHAYMDSVFKFFEELQKLELTKEEITLLVSVCMFSIDSCQLENYGMVEKLQAKYFNLLSQHLHAKYDHISAVKKLTKLLDCLIKLRDISSMYFQEMKELNDDEVLKESFPLLEEKFLPFGDS